MYFNYHTASRLEVTVVAFDCTFIYFYQELDSLVKTLTVAHKASRCCDDIPLEQVQKRHRQYLVS